MLGQVLADQGPATTSGGWATLTPLINSATGQAYFDFDANSFPGIWTAPCILPNGNVVVSNRRGQVLLFG